jgi:hypothetical protein
MVQFNEVQWRLWRFVAAAVAKMAGKMGGG